MSFVSAFNKPIVLKTDGTEIIKSQDILLYGAIYTEINKIMRDIEKRYGDANAGYSLTSIDFASSDFPLTSVDEVNKTISIRLPFYASQSDTKSLCQRRLNLAHELVHTITPVTDISKVSYLEEGLATVFSIEYVKDGDIYPEKNLKYGEAMALYSQLAVIDKDAIRKLRDMYPLKCISDYSTDEVMTIVPDISSNRMLVQQLLRKFYV